MIHSLRCIYVSQLTTNRTILCENPLFRTSSYFHRQYASEKINSTTLKGIIAKSKPPKMITIKDKIEDHDYLQKLNNIKKWLSKGITIRGIVSNVSQDPKKSENILSRLTKETEEIGKMEVKKRSGSDTKFNIQPKHQLNEENPPKPTKS